MNAASKIQPKAMSSKISISIIEDNKQIRDNICTYLTFSDDLEINQAYGSVESYLEQTSRLGHQRSDILLLDIGLPGMSGLEGLPLILESQPGIDVVMLTTYEDEDIVLKALCMGAVAYITKKSSLAEISDALRIVSNGGSYMSPMLAREIYKHFANPTQGIKRTESLLSPRQLDVLTKMVEGKTYKTIGEELSITIDTVKSHIKKLYKVLHVNNKAEAISKYLRGDI